MRLLPSRWEIAAVVIAVIVFKLIEPHLKTIGRWGRK